MRYSLGAILLIILSLFIGIFLTWPSYEKLALLRSEAFRKETEFENEEQYLEKIKTLDQKLQTFKKELEKVDTALPNEPSLPLLYDLIEDLASVSGLTLKSISSTMKSESQTFSPGLKTIDITLTLLGSYEGLKTFLESVQTAPRFLQLETLSFTSPKEGKFSFQVRLAAFSY